jgi:predicted  nucleic acid-binding Zn-ribbon protein
MTNEERLIEIMAELLAEVHDLKTELKRELVGLRKDVTKLNEQQVKTNLSIQELRTSVVKLADQQHTFRDHERRLRKLESKLTK